MPNLDKQNKTLSRRSFVVRAVQLTAFAGWTNLWQLLAASQSQANPLQAKSPQAKAPSKVAGSGRLSATPRYKFARWFGDDTTVGHQMRNGSLPDFDSLEALPTSQSTRVDFVIVGGGIAGLTAAYRLKDQDFILLEQYDSAGGQSQSLSHNGIDYALGASYYVDQDGPAGELVSELGLKPVELSNTMDSYWLDNRWQKPEDFAHKGLKQLKEIVSPIAQSLYNQSIPDYDSALLAADNATFADSLTALDGKFKAYLDSYLKSTTCATAGDISLLAGADMTNELFGTRYVLPGGNGAISKALIKAIKARGEGRIKTGTFVWSIKITDQGATVIYQRGKNNAAPDLVRVDCKHLIICTPPMVTGRILSGVGNQAKGNLFWLRYGSYLVSNLLLSKPVETGTFDNFVSADGAFSDMTVAQTPYQLLGQYKESMGAVLTIYKPWSPGTEGRALLLAGDKSALIAPVLKQVTNLTGKTMDQLGLQEIVMARWGHAIAVPVPHYYQKLCKIYGANQSPKYSLAHSSLYGVQCLESAVEAGSRAAKRSTITT